MLLKLCFVTLFYLVSVTSALKTPEDFPQLKINGEPIKGNAVKKKTHFMINGEPIKGNAFKKQTYFIIKTDYGVCENETIQITCEIVNITGDFVNMSVGTNNTESHNKKEVPCNKSSNSTICLSKDITPRINDTFTCVTNKACGNKNDQCIETYVHNVNFVKRDICNKSDNLDTNHTEVKKKTTEDPSTATAGNETNPKPTAAEITIKGLNESKIINKTKDSIYYEYDEGEKIEWDCIFRSSNQPSPRFYLYWETEKDTKSNKISNDMKKSEIAKIEMVLHSQSNITNLVCHFEEISTAHDKFVRNQTVHLSVKAKSKATNNSECNSGCGEKETAERTARNSTDITDKIDKTEKLKEKNNTMYIVIAILAVIFLITFLIITAIACRRKKVVNQHQQQNTVVHCTTSMKKSDVVIADEAYTNPVDVYYSDTTPVSSNYSDPYVALYTAPIPKNKRKIVTNNECRNTDKRNDYVNVTDKTRINKKESIPYENLKEEYNSKYANLNGKNNKAYDELNDTGSNLYYSVVDK